MQRNQIAEFIADHGFEVIHEETDVGISGLVESRPGLNRLLKEWIQNPDAPAFEYLILNDITRWGRFQSMNIIAHYEYLCKLYGKKIIYVSRGALVESQRFVSHPLITTDRHRPNDCIRHWRNRLSQRIVQSLISSIS